MKLKAFLKLAASVLRRLDAWLPPEQKELDWSALAYRWQSIGKKGILENLPRPHTFPLNRLAAVGGTFDLSRHRVDGHEVVTATAWLPLRDRGGTPT